VCHWFFKLWFGWFWRTVTNPAAVVEIPKALFDEFSPHISI
jgi:hypothetical protein